LDLATPLQFVKGIGPARAEMLAAKGLQTVSDLLYYAPFRYEDRSNVKPIAQLAKSSSPISAGSRSTLSLSLVINLMAQPCRSLVCCTQIGDLAE